MAKSKSAKKSNSKTTKQQPEKKSNSMIIGAVLAAVIVGGLAINAGSSSNTDIASAQEDSSVSASSEPTQTITELAVENENLSTLEVAVIEAGLADTLSSDGPFTVFAPSDEAFSALLDELDASAEELLARDNLADILTYHVVPSRALAADLSDGQELTTVLGEKLLASINDGNVSINGANVSTADVQATNGVVHVIDSVLLPGGEQLAAAQAEANGTVVDIAVNNGFDTLVAAVTEAGLADTLAGDGKFTVFAPTNEAFETLLETLGASPDDLLAREDLADILLYHVLPGTVLAEDVVAASGTNLDTLLEGREWHVLADDSGVFILNPTTAEKIAEIVATDIRGTNGVVHVIDAVLIL